VACLLGAMALPREFAQYAENLYRRFPEEFLALGAPGLEEIYDLRPNGTWTRSIQETPMEKIIEVKLQRWHQPLYPHMPAGAYSHGLANRFGHQQAAHMPPQPYLWPAPAASQWEVPAYSGSGYSEPPVAVVSCLTRLETALSVLAPQIEALHARAMRPEAHRVSQQIPTSPGAGSSSDKNVIQSHSSEAHVQVAEKTTAVENEQKPTLHPAVKRLEPESSQKKETMFPSDPGKNDTSESRRPVVNINAVRVSPGIHDPQSPRSPGRYSAWK